jgi:hypothetical protein
MKPVRRSQPVERLDPKPLEQAESPPALFRFTRRRVEVHSLNPSGWGSSRSTFQSSRFFA